MALTDERRNQIRETLAANADTRAGAAWANLDLDELDDNSLLTLNAWNDTMSKMENGVACPCGRTHRVDFDNGQRWISEGTPKASKLPATLNEARQLGIGSQQEWERYDFAGTMLDQKKAEFLEDLTANLEGTEREEAWKEYKDLSLPELEKMHRRFVTNGAAKSAQAPVLPTNYFGQQGAPTVNSIPAEGVPVLDTPTLAFEPIKKRAQ